jgi:hypothetical protein
MIVNFLNSLILLGCLQGFIFSAILFFNSRKRLSDKLLAALLFVFSLASLNIYLSESELAWQVQVVLSLFPTIIFMAAGPLIFFYTRSLLDPAFSLGGKRKLHFLPVIIDLLPILVGWVLTIGFLLKLFTQDYLLSSGKIIDQYNSYSDVPRWISVTAYLVLAKRLYNRYKIRDASAGTTQQKSQLSWFSFYLSAFIRFQFVWLLFLIPYIYPSTRFVVLSYAGYYPIYIPMGFLIYALGIKGFLYSRLSGKPLSETTIKLSPGQSEFLVHAIVKSMEEEKLYLKPDLDLQHLVGILGLTSELSLTF